MSQSRIIERNRMRGSQNGRQSRSNIQEVFHILEKIGAYSIVYTRTVGRASKLGGAYHILAPLPSGFSLLRVTFWLLQQGPNPDIMRISPVLRGSSS